MDSFKLGNKQMVFDRGRWKEAMNKGSWSQDKAKKIAEAVAIGAGAWAVKPVPKAVKKAAIGAALGATIAKSDKFKKLVKGATTGAATGAILGKELKKARAK